MRPRSWGALYELVVVAAMALLLLHALGRDLLPDLLARAEDRGHAPAWVATALLLPVLGLWARACHFSGPLAMSAGTFQWRVARHDPAAWLRRERALTVLGGALLATLVAVPAGMALAATGAHPLVPALALWAALLALLLLASHLQRRDLDAAARLVPPLLAATGVVLAAGVAWGATGALLVGGWLLLAGAAAARRPAARGAGRRAALTPRWQLHRGARNRQALNAGVTMLDADVVRAAREREDGGTRKPLPAFAYRLPRPAGLAAVVLGRGLRAVAPAIALVLPLVFAVDTLLGPVAALLVTVLLELFVTVALARSAETWLDSDAPARMWAAPGRRVPVVLCLPALAVCAVLAAAVSLGMALPLSATLVLAVLPAAVLARRRSARRAVPGGALLATPMGAVPVDLVNGLVAGPDMALLALLATAAQL
ncbi:hypothetical protein [Streptomyces marincola]|uniref:hypothetical protein n=1 Tax=Streptomyces marincola TaxID=2878388 RepID=UPI001CF2359D|nr:hypothetical protein [Streptomyces marincola]UCM88281.1 hypothetical protein LC193_10100 [Streptomyces marincola]